MDVRHRLRHRWPIASYEVGQLKEDAIGIDARADVGLLTVVWQDAADVVAVGLPAPAVLLGL